MLAAGGTGLHARGVLAHACLGRIGTHHLAPVCLHVLAQQGLGVCYPAPVGCSAVKCDAGGGVDEVIVWTQVEVEGLVERAEGQTEGVRVFEDGRGER